MLSSAVVLSGWRITGQPPGAGVYMLISSLVCHGIGTGEGVPPAFWSGWSHGEELIHESGWRGNIPEWEGSSDATNLTFLQIQMRMQTNDAHNQVSVALRQVYIPIFPLYARGSL